MKIIELENVTKTYIVGDHVQKALDSVNLTLEEGKFIVVLGPSGAGKSTLLNLIGGFDNPTSGKIVINGKDITTLTSNELAEYRASTVGFVFQFYNLIPTLTVMENVALVKEISQDPLSAHELLNEVGLLDHAEKFNLAKSRQNRFLSTRWNGDDVSQTDSDNREIQSAVYFHDYYDCDRSSGIYRL